MISICIATYNGEKYIKEQLQSILCQLSPEDEIIVSDDSSTDSTVTIIEEFANPKIRILKENKYHSPIFNFEHAIKAAKGDYIFLCDQDDVWFPNKIQSIMQYLVQYDLVISDCKVTDKNLNVISESFFRDLKSGTGFWGNLIKNTYLGCCMAFKKEVLKYVLPFPKGIAMHDIWIGLSVDLNGDIFFLHEPLMYYRRHENNASSGGHHSKFSLLYRIQYRIQLLYYLLRYNYFC